MEQKFSNWSVQRSQDMIRTFYLLIVLVQATSPKTPEGFPVSIHTPAALIMDFKWHNSLPWIQFQQKVNCKLISRSELASVSMESSRNQLPSPHPCTGREVSKLQA